MDHIGKNQTSVALPRIHCNPICNRQKLPVDRSSKTISRKFPQRCILISLNIHQELPPYSPIIQSIDHPIILLILPSILINLYRLLPLQHIIPRHGRNLIRLLEELVHHILTLLRRIHQRIRKVPIAQPGHVPPDLNLRYTIRLPPIIAIPQRIRTPAVLLLVKSLLGRNFVLSQRHLVRLPILTPVLQSIVSRGCPVSRIVHLLGILPATRGVGRGDGVISVLVRVQCRPFHPHVEAGRASLPTLRVEFHTLHSTIPILRIVIAIHEFDA
mmetsp:Transcript_4885/g.7388  ORF Transcript_4885/g.7388 Transcript_4885/m.7388 type:complete len:271 (+) Transcript_4885:98-910(+)